MKHAMHWHDFGTGRGAFRGSYRDMLGAVLRAVPGFASQRTRVSLRYGLLVILVVLFSSVGIAHVAGRAPVSSGDAANVPELDGLPAVKAKCAGCGVIVSMRDIELRDDSTGFDAAGDPDETRVKSTKSHELTIRLADGSSRVITEASPARWRLGERVIVIDGASSSNR